MVCAYLDLGTPMDRRPGHLSISLDAERFLDKLDVLPMLQIDSGPIENPIVPKS